MTATQEDTLLAPLKRTPLYSLHLELGARMVPFAGYEMPVQYPAGLFKEHLHTREAAGLFDASHMGQAFLSGPDHATVAAALEAFVPGNIAGLKPGGLRYTQFLNEDGGIIDDLMVTRIEPDGVLMLVVNALRKDVDYAYLRARLPGDVTLTPLEDLALLALQGPGAAATMAELSPESAALAFMTAARVKVAGFDCQVSRSGYTGEDGFEISMAAQDAERLARALLAHPQVKPVGLGARDTLRLEAGFCLYGHDIDETTSPVEAALVWSLGKARRERGDFPGANRVQRELRDGPPRKRVGIRLTGKAPAREGCMILGAGGESVGRITSGSYAPSIGSPIAMGYVAASHAEPGSALQIVIRGTPHPARVVPMPFVPNRFFRKT
jgi:aminomethyltransferase